MPGRVTRKTTVHSDLIIAGRIKYGAGIAPAPCNCHNGSRNAPPTRKAGRKLRPSRPDQAYRTLHLLANLFLRQSKATPTKDAAGWHSPFRPTGGIRKASDWCILPIRRKVRAGLWLMSSMGRQKNKEYQSSKSERTNSSRRRNVAGCGSDEVEIQAIGRAFVKREKESHRSAVESVALSRSAPGLLTIARRDPAAVGDEHGFAGQVPFVC